MTDAVPRTVLSQGSFPQVGVAAFLDAAAGAGFDGVDIWRAALGYPGPEAVASFAAASGVQVNALCRGGFLVERDQALADERTRRSLDDAATLGAAHLVVMTGPSTTGSVDQDATDLAVVLDRLLPHAERAGVPLALEPFHPMFATDRSWLVTLAQANEVMGAFDTPFLGIAVDCYHLWWDPALRAQMYDARGRILAVHVSDWITPGPDILRSRGVPGEGVIPIRRFLRLAADAGYDGAVEIEVLSDRFRSVPAVGAARTLKHALDSVLPAPHSPRTSQGRRARRTERPQHT